MTRRNDKRNQRRNQREANTTASVSFGAILSKIFSEVLGKRDDAKDGIIEEPFDGIRKVSYNHYASGVKVPNDGTAAEIPIPKDFEVFISEEGKPMIRRKVEKEEESTNDEKKPLTYEQIAKELYKGQEVIYWSPEFSNEDEAIRSYKCERGFAGLYNCMTEAQVKRLMAFNKLQNIAYYLNDGWKPDFKDKSPKWFIYAEKDGYGVYYNTDGMGCGCLFKTAELAKLAIGIMGEKSLGDLYNANWY